MGKRWLFLLVSFLILNVTLQAKGKHRRNNRTLLNKAGPRAFRGQLIATISLSLPNWTHTQGPCSVVHQPPRLQALRLLSNRSNEYLSGRLSRVVIPSIYMLVTAVGIPANIAVLCALVTKVRTVSSTILYCSLALSDLLLLLSLIFKAHYHLLGNQWVFGETACRVVTACFYGNLYCSAHTLACMSVKRYLAVVHPFLYRSLPKRACAAWTCLAVWVVFGAAVVPELLVQQSYRLPQLGLTTCHDVLPFDSTSHALLLYYKLCLTLACLLLPLVVTVVCHVRVVYELNCSHHDWALYVRTSSLVFVIFLVCFAPAGTIHFLHYLRLFTGEEESFYAYFNVAVCLCCLHSCLDPFLFLLMSRSAGSSLLFTSLKGKTVSSSI